MVRWAAMTGDDTYYNWLKGMGNNHQWKLYDRHYHADDHTVGQMYRKVSILYFIILRKFKYQVQASPPAGRAGSSKENVLDLNCYFLFFIIVAIILMSCSTSSKSLWIIFESTYSAIFKIFKLTLDSFNSLRLRPALFI